jgi:hypothetical protein
MQLEEGIPFGRDLVLRGAEERAVTALRQQIQRHSRIKVTITPPLIGTDIKA